MFLLINSCLFLTAYSSLAIIYSHIKGIRSTFKGAASNALNWDILIFQHKKY